MATAAEQVFLSFCGLGKTDMDGKGFAKLAKDCHLLDRKCTATDIDLIFAKVVVKGQRRIGFQQFETALSHIAQKKGANVDSVVLAVENATGPVMNATQADAVKFHDDKSTYTGVHVNGGPDAFVKGRGHLPPEDVIFKDGLRPEPVPSKASAKVVASPREKVHQPVAPKSPAKAPSGYTPTPAPIAPSSSGGSIEEVFQSYCGNQVGMDGKSLAKVCKDCSLTDRAFTPTDVDLIFAKVVPKGLRRIDLHQFRDALNLIAAKKGKDASEIIRIVESSGGPVLNGTRADAVKFHDDKSTYTGVHIRGGPESVAVGVGTATQLASSGMRLAQ
jgi:hypothetical protein